MNSSGTEVGAPLRSEAARAATLFFDFVDPLSWAISQAVERARQAPLRPTTFEAPSARPAVSTGWSARLEWTGFELAPSPWSGIDAAGPKWRARQAMAQRWAREWLRDGRDGRDGLPDGRAGPDGPDGPDGARDGREGPEEEEARHGPASGARIEAPSTDPALLPWTRKAHELCELCRGRGLRSRMRRSLFNAHFSEGLDIGRIDVLVELAVRAGLDRAQVKAALDVDHHTDAVLRNRELAVRLGVRDVPAVELPQVVHLAELPSLSEVARVIGSLVEPKERT